MAIKFFFLPTIQNVENFVKQTKANGIKNIGATALNAFELYNQVLILPVNPETLKVTTGSDNKTTNVVKLGQIVIPKGPELARLSISSFFPGTTNNFWSLVDIGMDTASQYIPQSYMQPVNALMRNFTPEQYFQYFENLQKQQIPVKLVVSDCGVNMDVVIENIEKEYVTCDSDLHYTIDLIEYRYHTAKKLDTKSVVNPNTPVPVVPVTPPRPKKGLAIGDTVIVNGRYWYDSFGSKPFGTFTNFKGKISHMASNKNASYKYHITTLTGGWRGWVKADQIQGVD